MLDAGKISIIVIIIIINGLFYKYFIKTYFVKRNMTGNQSAVVKNNGQLLKATQRLNARNLHVLNNKIYSISDFEAYFVGLIEGDGCFSITKKGIYLTYELSLEMSIRDIQLLYKLRKILGIGIVSPRKDRPDMVNLRIKNKKDLKSIILPIFDKYPMLTNKELTYQWFRKNLLDNVVNYDKLEAKGSVPLIYSSDKKSKDYKLTMERISVILSTKYFESWLVGFI